MRVNFYLNRNGVLKRKENTIYFVSKDNKFVLPINRIHSIFCYGRITFTSGVLSYLAKEGITVHLFNYYGYYDGTFYPRESLVSGDVVVKQAEHYLDHEKRMKIAREIVRGCAWNIRKNLMYYKQDAGVSQVRYWEERIEDAKTTSELMNVEGNIWSSYFSCFDDILPAKYRFVKRTRRPPENIVNCLISFANSLVYSNVLSEIYNTQLYPAISFLHEPFERRFSLSLDLAEIFKPFLGDRVIFKVLNKGILSEDDFEKDLNFCTLNERGRRIFLQHFDERLRTTIKHKALGRNVSYQRLIRLECYKLTKHLLGTEEYSSFKMWW
jgi:CRISPR-associated protein Cas1